MSEAMTYEEIIEEILGSDRLDEVTRKRVLALRLNLSQNITLGLHQMDRLNEVIKVVRRPLVCQFLEKGGGCAFKARSRFFQDREDTRCNIVRAPQTCEFYREKQGGINEGDEDGD